MKWWIHWLAVVLIIAAQFLVIRLVIKDCDSGLFIGFCGLLALALLISYLFFVINFLVLNFNTYKKSFKNKKVNWQTALFTYFINFVLAYKITILEMILAFIGWFLYNLLVN